MFFKFDWRRKAGEWVVGGLMGAWKKSVMACMVAGVVVKIGIVNDKRWVD